MRVSVASSQPKTAFFNVEHSLVLLGPSQATLRLVSQIRSLAPHLRTALLGGVQDCGQAAIARLLLALSKDPHRQFCALSSSEAEQRLDDSSSLGLPLNSFVFLPDADRLSMAAQQQVARMLSSRHSITIVAAATEDLRALAGVNRYLPELANALEGGRVEVPALKDRVEDIPMLLNESIRSQYQARQLPVPRIAEAIVRSAMQHDWPGNFRELAGIVDYFIGHYPHKKALNLPEWTRALVNQRDVTRLPETSVLPDLNTIILQHVRAVLKATGGNKMRAAVRLGVSRSTLYRLTKEANQEGGLHLVKSRNKPY